MNVALAFLVVPPALALGSFLNVVAARLPEGRSIVNPPSACGSCGTRLAWRDNIPVVSYLLLRGRCGAGEPRPPYLAVEVRRPPVAASSSPRATRPFSPRSSSPSSSCLGDRHRAPSSRRSASRPRDRLVPDRHHTDDPGVGPGGLGASSSSSPPPRPTQMHGHGHVKLGLSWARRGQAWSSAPWQVLLRSCPDLPAAATAGPRARWPSPSAPSSPSGPSSHSSSASPSWTRTCAAQASSPKVIYIPPLGDGRRRADNS